MMSCTREARQTLKKGEKIFFMIKKKRMKIEKTKSKDGRIESDVP